MPHDSRGETVYEVQGPTQMDQPVVPGRITSPKPIKQVDPKFSRATRRSLPWSTIVIWGVVAPKGDLIDLRPEGSLDSHALQPLLKAFSRWRFVPAKLDGKPVAVLGCFQVTLDF
jgi:hypothetical protein